MWRRLACSQLKTLANLRSSAAAAPHCFTAAGVSRPSATVFSSHFPTECAAGVSRPSATVFSSHFPTECAGVSRPSATVFSSHFITECGNVATKKKVEDVMPIATGHEREELEAELDGKDILAINYPVGPFGRKKMYTDLKIRSEAHGIKPEVFNAWKRHYGRKRSLEVPLSILSRINHDEKAIPSKEDVDTVYALVKEYLPNRNSSESLSLADVVQAIIRAPLDKRPGLFRAIWDLNFRIEDSYDLSDKWLVFYVPDYSKYDFWVITDATTRNDRTDFDGAGVIFDSCGNMVHLHKCENGKDWDQISDAEVHTIREVLVWFKSFISSRGGDLKRFTVAVLSDFEDAVQVANSGFADKTRKDYDTACRELLSIFKELRAMVGRVDTVHIRADYNKLVRWAANQVVDMDSSEDLDRLRAEVAKRAAIYNTPRWLILFRKKLKSGALEGTVKEDDPVEEAGPELIFRRLQQPR